MHLTLPLALLMACQPGPAPATPAVGDTDTDTGSLVEEPLDCPESLAWSTAAAPLLLSQCASCHGSQREGASRYGAPEDVNLDTPADASMNGERALARLRTGDMPPAANVPAHQTDRLEQWLACGGPGEATPWPTTTAAPAIAMADHLSVAVEADEADPSVLLVSYAIDVSFEPFLSERWLVSGNDLWLVERERWNPDGSSIFLDQWEPPVAVLADGAPAGDTETWRRHTEDGLSTEHAERWTSEEADSSSFYPEFFRDGDAQGLLLSSDSGVVATLLLSVGEGPTQISYDEPGLDPLGDLFRHLRTPTDLAGLPTGTILYDGQRWVGRVIMGGTQ